MTMWAETGFPILTVIVTIVDIAVRYLLFSAGEEKRRSIAKTGVFAVASMALVYTNAFLQGSSRSLEPSKMRLTA